MADHIAILAAPGKLVASGSPVALKRDLGEGYSLSLNFSPADSVEKSWTGPSSDLLRQIRILTPQAHISATMPYHVLCHLKSKDTVQVEKVLQLVDSEKDRYNIVSYDVLGTTIEDIFLDLMAKESIDAEKLSSRSSPSLVADSSDSLTNEPLQLSDGRPMPPFRQALTIFHKRALIARRSWPTLLLAVLVAVAGSTIPLVFIVGRSASCVKTFDVSDTIVPLYIASNFLLPSIINASSPGNISAGILNSPPGVVSAVLGNATGLSLLVDVADNSTFVDLVKANFRSLDVGGVSFDLDSGSSLIAWEATPPGLIGPSILNLATNVLFGHSLNSSGLTVDTIQATYESFPPIDAGTLFALKWVAFFGAVIVVIDTILTF